MSVSATLGGVAVTLGNGLVWGLKYGTTPYEHVFPMSRARARSILAKKGPISLIVKAEGYPRLEVRNLYALHAVPVDENNMGVRVADARWLLTRKAITKDYNLRRRTGDYRRVGNQLQEMQNKNVIADYVYHKASLHPNGTPWTPRQMLDDMLTELVGAGEFRLGGTQFAITVEGLSLDRDRGDQALARVLGYLPGARLYVDLDGRFVVTSSLDGSEARALRDAGPRYQDMPGQVEFIDRSAIRPEVIRVQFEPEPEMRFDYYEDDPTGADTTRVRGIDPRIVQNVIPVVDPTLTLNGKTVTQGTWLTLQDWLTAVNAKGDAPEGRPAMTAQMLREQYLSGFQLLRMNYVRMQLPVASLIWHRRIAALAKHYRQTFRILPQWMGRLRSIRAVRSSILDQETGSRGKAEAFFDHFVVHSRRSLYKGNEGTGRIGFNVSGWASDLTGKVSAPVDITIIDDEAGIFRLDYKADPWGDGFMLAPGLIDDAAALLLKQVASANPTLFTSLAAKLQASWKLAVVLTVVTASPNNNNRLYAIDVNKDTAYGVLGVPAPGGSDGPVWTIGISAGMETARFMWSDSWGAEIEKVVYGDTRLAPFPNGKAPEANPWAKLALPLLTNKATTKALAEAAAARIQSALMDRWEGAQSVRFNPALKPRGSMAAVTHAVLGNGALVTHISLPPISMSPSIYALLPEGARKILQRMVQP